MKTHLSIQSTGVNVACRSFQYRSARRNSVLAAFLGRWSSALVRALILGAVACGGIDATAGPTGLSKTGSNTCDSPKSGGNEGAGCGCGGSKGMPTYTVDAPLVSLRITDTPVGCKTPVGPAVPVTLSYTQNNDTQPATQGYGNVGPRWYLNWVSYIQDNPASPGSGIWRVPMGGGAIPYTGSYDATAGAINPDGLTLGSTRDRMYLVSSNPVRYELRRADGSKQVFAHSDGAATSPRKVFLTQVVDASGNAVTLSYDGNHRLVQLTDAIGRNTTFQYNASNSLLLTDIYDPYGRRAQLGYDANGRLNSITDAIGMTSTFTYNEAGIISAMTTPYGTTTFTFGGAAPNNWLNVTDPLGMTERVEFNQGVGGIPYNDPQYPDVSSRGVNGQNAWQNYRNVFFWDKSVYQQYGVDYAKARLQHMLHDGGTSSATNILESTKTAASNRVLYLYPGVIDGGLRSGVTDLPWLIAQRLPDGSTAITEKTYNSLGNVTRIVDPTGSQTIYTYASNLIDVLQKTQTGPNGVDVVTASFTYNEQHLPVTYTDAAGLTTNYTYNDAGQVTSATDANGLVTTRTYDSKGYLLSVTRPDGVVGVIYTYDSFGRVATETDAGGYTRGFTYDNLDRITRITHPDGTHEDNTWDKLDLVADSDRAGQVTSYAYDAMRRLVSETNPVGQTTTYTYFPAGQRKTKTDGNGNVESWTYDVEGRVASYANALGQVTSYAYDSAGRLSTVIAPTGQTTALTYDASNRLRQESRSATGVAARTTTYSYTPEGQLKTVTYPDGRVVSNKYDNALRLVATKDARGNAAVDTLDVYGNAVSTAWVDAEGFQRRGTERSFDLLHRVQQTTAVPVNPGSSTSHDVDFANVVLLLHANGTDGSTSVVDDSSTPKSVTAAGDAKISTMQSKFGGASLAFDGTGDYLTIPNGPDFNFGSGDFTVEGWFRLAAATSGYRFVFVTRGPGVSLSIRFGDSGFGGRLQFAINDTTLAGVYSSEHTQATLAGAWHHVALTRSGGQVRAFLDGNLLGLRNNNYSGDLVTSWADGTSLSSLDQLRISDESANAWSGHIDEIRITKGVARYTTNFTPPTQQFTGVAQ